MDSNDEVLEVAQGDTATIQCPVGGIPEPKVQLIRNGRVLGTLSATGFKIRDLGVSDVGDYYCSASNTHVNPPLGKRRLTVNKKITIHLIGEYSYTCTPLTLHNTVPLYGGGGHVE